MGGKVSNKNVRRRSLPDFLERKELLKIIHKKLLDGGYIRTGFECYSLPNSPTTEAFEKGEAHYGICHQPGGRVNFIAIGSFSMSNLGTIIMFKIFMIFHPIKSIRSRFVNKFPRNETFFG